MTQVEIENIKTYTGGHKKFAMVLCLKIINLGPTQEKIKKIAVVRCLKTINVRPEQGKIKIAMVLCLKIQT